MATFVLCAPAAAAQRVVGGTQAPAGSYPWQVGLLSSAEPSNYLAQFCGGTLISPTRVLTAAHCAQGATPTSIDVLAGTTSLFTGGERIDVVAIEAHPQAVDPGDGSYQYDASMLRLARAVSTARPIGVVTPAQDDLWAPANGLRVTGWGRVRYNNPFTTSDDGLQDGDYPADLREAAVPRRPDASCGSIYGAFDATDMLCAAPVSGGVDTCQGDSGGPIAARTVASSSRYAPGDWRLAGATSWGAGCADFRAPGVYTRLGAEVLRSWSLTALVGDDPYSIAPPVLSGSTEVGQTVTCGQGEWGGGPTSFTYAFERVTDSAATTVALGPEPGYVITAADADARLACTVRADKVGGSALSSSPSIGPVATPPAPAPPAAAPTPAATPVPLPTATPTPVAPVDRIAPRITSTRRRCTRTRCTLTIRITDAGSPAGGVRVSAALRARVRGRTRRRTLTARARSSRSFAVSVPRLGRGSYRVTLRAVDRAGNRARSATVVTYRLR